MVKSSCKIIFIGVLFALSFFYNIFVILDHLFKNCITGITTKTNATKLN